MVIDQKYRDWITQHYPTPESALGNCRTATEKMVAEFPELKRTNGFVYAMGWGERMHWWCVDQNGKTIDPTAHQYQSLIVAYTEIDDKHPARNYRYARCMNCGERYYETPELNGTMHTKECEESFGRYMNGAKPL